MSDDTETPEDETIDENAVEGEETETESETESNAGSKGDDNGMKLEDMNDPTAEYNEDDEFEPGEPMARDVEAIYDIPVQISAVLGRSTMQVSQLLKLGRGAVVELDRKVGEAIDIYVNNRLVARGEVVVVDDKLGVTMTEIVKTDRA